MISPEEMTEIDNRYSHHAPFGDQEARYQQVRAQIRNLAVMICSLCPNSRERSTALTFLDQVMFFSNAAIARNEKPNAK